MRKQLKRVTTLLLVFLMVASVISELPAGWGGQAYASGSDFIRRVAGTGSSGYSGDGGAATSANINRPNGVAVDSNGNLYIADQYNNVIRKVATNGTISTVAGTGTAGYLAAQDGGTAISAMLNSPSGVAVDSNFNLYIADTGNNRIRKVATDGTISTVAGGGTGSYTENGLAATLAPLFYPIGVAVDSNFNLYIADKDSGMIRKVATDGTISTVAGNGTDSYSGDGGAATSAQLFRPDGVAVDSNFNLYISDSYHGVIRKVDFMTGKISIVAGTFSFSGNYSGDGGAATSARLSGPTGMAVDNSGNLYIADSSNYRIRKVATNGTISTVAGTGLNGGTTVTTNGVLATSAQLNAPSGVAVDSSGILYIADTFNYRILKMEKAYTVTFNSNNGSAVSSQMVTYNGTATKPANPTKPGYSFLGWYTDSGFMTPPFTFTTAITDDTVLYAMWMAAVTGVTLDQSTLSLEAGGSTAALTATVSPSDAGNKNVTWSSDKPSVATVDSSGVVTPVGAGTATITVTTTDGGKKAMSVVTVNAPAQTVSAFPATLTPGVGVDDAITLTVKDFLGNIDTTFSGWRDVTVTGYEAAPDNTYGSFNGTALTASPNTISVLFASGVATANLTLNKAEAQTIGLSVVGVATPAASTLSITPAAGSTVSMALTTDIAAPASNGGAFVQQPVVTLLDAYGNTNVSDNTTDVTVTIKDSGTLTLTGTATKKANSGVVTFTDLGATNAAEVTGAQLSFDADSLPQLTSAAVTLPAPTPAHTVSASAAAAALEVGVANAITLTVKDSLGIIDTTFSGWRDVTVTGYEAAPDNTYGSFNGTALTASSNMISVLFASGVATANLRLNKATAQTISLSVAGVATPAASTLSITPTAGSTVSMALTKDITAPASNGGAFAQQPVVVLQDVYGNTSVSDNTTDVTVTIKDSGTWTLTGTATKKANSGVVTFTDLGATNVAGVTGAQLAFDATGLTRITSSTVSLPAFATAPNAPTGVTAAAGNGQATISFTSPANGGSAITHYEVTASPGNITAMGTESPITITGLSNGTTYTFTVKAVNSEGSSVASTASNAVTPTSSNGGNGGGSAPTPTPTPTQSAVSGNAQISLTWDPVDGATDYQIFKSVTSATYGAEVDTVNGSVYSYVVTGLTNGTTYYFVIKAINSEGDSLAFIELSATPKTVSAVPTGVTAAAGDGQAAISFTIPADNGGSAITGYEVTVSPGNITVMGTASPITVTGLSNGTAYTFTVKAINSAGRSAASTASNSVTPRSTVNEEEETSSSPTPSTTLSPEKEIITVDVEDSDAKAGDIVSKAVIERTTQADGTKHDEVNLTAEQAKKMVDSIIAAGSTSASIVIPDAKDEVSELNVTVSKESREMITDANIDLGITTENVKVIIPNESLQGFTDDLYFHFIPIKDEATKQEVKERANNEAVVKIVAGDQEVSVVGRPMTIETNMQNRQVTLVMPLRNVNLSEEEMKNLGIYIEHSDGTKELLKGVLVPYNNKGEMGLQFTVNKFSTFTLVQLPAANQHTAYMNGYEDGTFRPDRSITRAEMAAILSRVIAGDAKSADKAYSDVSSTQWAKEAISKVTKMGLMNGYEDGTFAPEKAITRAEMATLVALIIGDKQQAGAGFTDISGHWAKASILKAQGAEIFSGYEGGTFQPDSSLTRAEAVAIINKLLGRGPLSGAEIQWTDVPEQHWAYGQVQEASVDHAYEQKSNDGEKWVPAP